MITEAKAIQTEEQAKHQYINNRNLLMSYPYISKANPIPEEFAFNANKPDAQIFGVPDLPEDSGNKVLICSDIISSDAILWLLNKTYKETILWQKTPMILYYNSFQFFVERLHLMDLSEILKSERVVFVFGEDELTNYLMPSSIRPPEFHIAGEHSDIAKFEAMLNQLLKAKSNYYTELRKRIDEFYANKTKEQIIDKLKDKTAKIAVVTCRFSTAIQYYSRDVQDAFNDLGYETKYVIETNDISFIGIEWLDEFKPDVVFVINYSSFELGLPKNIICLNWIQDNMDKFVNPDYAKKATDFDYFLLMGFNHKDVVKNLKELQCVAAPCGANTKIYKTYELTDEEKSKYAADICFVSNYGTIDVPLANFIKIFGVNVISKKIIPDLVNQIYDDVYNERKHYRSPQQALQILRSALKKQGININANLLKQMAYHFNYLILSYVYKMVPIMWLDEEITKGRLQGKTLKLWGNSWHTHPVLYKYAMGVAQNGETLSKILNASTVSLGINAANSSHPRFAESFLSNSFCLYNYIGKEDDYGPLTDVLDINEDDFCFYSRKNMVDSVLALLQNDGWRKERIKDMQSQIIEKFSFISLAKNTINFITKGEHDNVQM